MSVEYPERVHKFLDVDMETRKLKFEQNAPPPIVPVHKSKYWKGRTSHMETIANALYEARSDYYDTAPCDDAAFHLSTELLESMLGEREPEMTVAQAVNTRLERASYAFGAAHPHSKTAVATVKIKCSTPQKLTEWYRQFDRWYLYREWNNLGVRFPWHFKWTKKARKATIKLQCGAVHDAGEVKRLLANLLPCNYGITSVVVNLPYKNKDEIIPLNRKWNTRINLKKTIFGFLARKFDKWSRDRGTMDVQKI